MLTQVDVLPKGRFLSSQERQFVTLYAQGMTAKAAARAAGYSLPAALALIERQDVIETLTLLRQRQNEELGVYITRDFVGGMLLEAHKKAVSATEEISAARELAKLYGLNAPEKTVSVTYNVSRIEQLETLPDAELARLAGLDRTIAALPSARVEDDDETPCPSIVEEAADAGE